MIVYIILEEDGNVCCPGTKVAGVATAKARAEELCTNHNVGANVYPYRNDTWSYEEWETI